MALRMLVMLSLLIVALYAIPVFVWGWLVLSIIKGETLVRHEVSTTVAIGIVYFLGAAAFIWRRSALSRDTATAIGVALALFGVAYSVYVVLNIMLSCGFSPAGC